MISPPWCLSLNNVSSWQELNSIEVRTVFDGAELEALGKGKMMLTLSAADNPSMKLTAKLVSRISCDIFDCVLQPTDSRGQGDAGIAYMYFTRDGGLKYNVQWVAITLELNIKQLKIKIL